MSRNTIFIRSVALALVVNIAIADVEYTTLTLSSPRTGFGAIEADSKVYFAGGFHYGDVAATRIIEVYDLVTQNMTDPLFLEHPRGQITPVVIEPNIYFVGGLTYTNPPFSYDLVQHTFVNNGTGPTVVGPKRLALHNSLLIVMGRAGVDVVDLEQWIWLDTTQLRDLLTQVALPTIVSHEGVVLLFSGRNVSTTAEIPWVWAYDIANKEITPFPDVLVAGFSLLGSSSSNGVIAVNSVGPQVFLYHAQSRVLRREIISPSHVLTFDNKTFLFNTSGLMTVDWTSGSESTFQSSSSRVLYAFLINDYPVYMTVSDMSTVVIYVYTNGTWSPAMTLSLLITKVEFGVNLPSWHMFVADVTVVFGYNPALNQFYQQLGSNRFGRIAALMPAEENTDVVYIVEVGRYLSKVVVEPDQLHYYYLRQDCVIVPITRLGTDFLDAAGRVMNTTDLTRVIEPNASLSSPAYVFNSLHFVLMEGANNILDCKVNYDRVDIYNYVTGEWGNSTDLPQELTDAYPPDERVNFYPAAAMGNKLVVWQGNATAVYDPSTAQWTTHNSYLLSPVHRQSSSYLHFPVPVAQGSAYLRTGGRTFDVFSNGSLETWTTTTATPTVEDYPNYLFQQCLVHNDSQIFVTSLVSSVPGTPNRYNTLFKYDVHGDTWSYQQLPNALQAMPVIALAGNYLLALQNDGLLSYYDIVNDIWSNQEIDFVHAPAFTFETSANITFIGGGATALATWVDQVLIIPHGTIVSKPQPVAAPIAAPETVAVGLSQAELIVAIVVPVGAVLIGAALLLILLLRRQKRRRGQSTAMIGLAGKYGQWFIPYEQIKFGAQLGQGASGQVFKGTWNNTTVALKISMTQANATVIAELELMMQLRPHPNVIQLLGFSVHPETDSIILAIEFCNGGSLDDTLFAAKESMSMQQKVTWLLGMARGLEHLHANNIVHRDIAARNVLLHQNEPKITDFGMSRLLEEDKQRGTTKSELGPIRWMAPESLKSKEYSNKSDIWSFGILMYEVVAQSEPHADADPIEIGRLIRDNGVTPTIPPSCPPSLAELMRECWHVAPDKRISIDKIAQRLEAMQNK